MSKNNIYIYKNIQDHINALIYSYPIQTVFYDFIEMFALELAISVGIDADKREEALKRTASKYTEEELKHYNGFKTEIIKEFIQEDGKKIIFQDLLGIVFHELELHNHYKGQFFTPYPIAKLTSLLSLEQDTLEREDFIELNEPASGAGAIAIASCDIASFWNINYAEKLIWTLQDIDLMCVYMSYIQLNLIGASAVIHHMDSLNMNRFDTFYTASYVLNKCAERVKRKRQSEKLKNAFNFVRSIETDYNREFFITEDKREKYLKYKTDKTDKKEEKQFVFDF